MTRILQILAFALGIITVLASCKIDNAELSDESVVMQNPFAGMRWGGAMWQTGKWDVPGRYTVVPDPETGDKAVQKFTLREGDCAWKDCQYNSGRFEVTENIWDKPRFGERRQPEEAWYSWEVRLDEGTLYGRNQPMGPIILGQFKQQNINCPILTFRHQSGHNDSSLLVALARDTGLEPPRDCDSSPEQVVGTMPELIGRWARVEMFIRWSSGDDGWVDVYLDGEQRMAYKGPTCVRNCQRIFRKYGIYFANQRGGTPLTEINAFYRNVGRASKREGLPRQ